MGVRWEPRFARRLRGELYSFFAIGSDLHIVVGWPRSRTLLPSRGHFFFKVRAQLSQGNRASGLAADAAHAMGAWCCAGLGALLGALGLAVAVTC